MCWIFTARLEKTHLPVGFMACLDGNECSERQVMQELKVVGNEDGALVVTNDAGERFRVVVDEALRSEVRRLHQKADQHVRVSPRTIQAHIRAGRSRDEIHSITGASHADIERYEPPVLAERDFILSSAQAVTVLLGAHAPQQHTTFGEAIAQRISELGVDSHEWNTWKDDDHGWMVSLTFIQGDQLHEARWSFAHKQHVLHPENDAATRLSKQGDISEQLIPKLRAVEQPGSTDRFDSGAFNPETLEPVAPTAQATLPIGSAVDASRAVRTTEPPQTPDAPTAAPEQQATTHNTSVEARAVSRSTVPSDFGQTSDLLEALRRRRDQRDSGAFSEPVDPLDATTLSRITTANTSTSTSTNASVDASNLDPAPAHSAELAEPATAAQVRSEGSDESLTSSLPNPLTTSSLAPVVRIHPESSELPAGSLPSIPPAPPSAHPEPAPAPAATLEPTPAQPQQSQRQQTVSDSPAGAKSKRKRMEMPSWDDILFGAKSDE